MSPEFAQSDSANRRRSFRFSAEFKVEMASLGSARRFAESMCDFSPTGVRLRSTQAVPTGTHFELTVPDVAKGFFLGGEVVWCRPEQDGAYKVGIRFSQLDAPIGDRAILDGLRVPPVELELGPDF